MKIISVVGARPNFMKIVPIHKEFEKQSAVLSRSRATVNADYKQAARPGLW